MAATTEVCPRQLKDLSNDGKLRSTQQTNDQTMSKSTTIRLGDTFDAFNEDQVATGRFGSASDVVQAGLSLLQQQDAKLAILRAALAEGEASGPSTAFDFEVYISRKVSSSFGAIRGQPHGSDPNAPT